RKNNRKMTENQNPENENLSFENRIDLSNLKEKTILIKQEIGKVIVGQEQMIELLLVGLLSKGHVLIEGVPGVAKTITAKLLSRTINTGFSRIQFTPDLMPSDILGTSVYNSKINDFEFKSGPIFSNCVLIDEINRAPAKTQAALCEVMEERQVTIDAQRYQMQEPFVVIATQNPIEQEGTYQLPEAQLDRFLFKITVDYPTLEQEINILMKEHELLDKDKIADVNAVISAEEIIAFQKVVKHIIIENHLIEYIANIVYATRNNPL